MLRQLNVTEAACFLCHNQFHGSKAPQDKKLKHREKQNLQLGIPFAEAEPSKAVLKELVGLAKSAFRKPLKRDIRVITDRAPWAWMRAYARTHAQGGHHQDLGSRGCVGE